MEYGRYYIYEITDYGVVKKALNREFRSKQEAEDSIKTLTISEEKKRFVTVRVNR